MLYIIYIIYIYLVDKLDLLHILHLYHYTKISTDKCPQYYITTLLSLYVTPRCFNL